MSQARAPQQHVLRRMRALATHQAARRRIAALWAVALGAASDSRQSRYNASSRRKVRRVNLVTFEGSVEESHTHTHTHEVYCSSTSGTSDLHHGELAQKP